MRDRSRREPEEETYALRLLARDGWNYQADQGSGSLVELIKMLPDGIGVIPLFNDVRHGRIEEFKAHDSDGPRQNFLLDFQP